MPVLHTWPKKLQEKSKYNWTNTENVSILDTQIINTKINNKNKVIAGMIKAVGPMEMQQMYRIIRKIWQSNEIPDDKRKGVYKKGD
jgi:hypothetical protein